MSKSDPVYLDFNASTPLAPEVALAIEQLLHSAYGNPSTRHWAGVPARAIVESSREDVARLLGARPSEIVFTSGGSEASNAAIKGAFYRHGKPGCHIITSAIEHPATLEPCRWLERTHGVLPVDRFGRVDPNDVRDAVTDETLLITIMHANNEVGTIQPIERIAEIANARGVLLHVDAAQAIGKIDVNVDTLGADLLSIAGHKFYAPKGIGALYIRDGVEIEPLIHGAGHEGGRRAGTESALLAAALGAAARLAADRSKMADVQALRDRFWDALQRTFGSTVVLNGHPEERLPNTLNVSFIGHIGAELLEQLDGVAASTGSACHEGVVDLSPVLAAMGVDPDVGAGTIRFSLGRTTTAAEIDSVVEQIAALPGLRKSA